MASSYKDAIKAKPTTKNQRRAAKKAAASQKPAPVVSADASADANAPNLHGLNVAAITVDAPAPVTPANGQEAVPASAAAAAAQELPVFKNRDEGLQYLATKTGYDIEQLKELAAFAPNQFSHINNTIGPSDLDGEVDGFKKRLKNIEYAYEHQPEVGNGRKSKGDWATKGVRDAAVSLVDKNKAGPLFPGGAYTVHHKVSRLRLRGLHTKMEADPAAAAPVTAALGAIVPGVQPLKALLNIPGNLEVGPQDRIGDPGSGFDPNLADGEMTPRSKTLNDVDTLIGGDKVDFAEVAKKLQVLHAQQQKALKGTGETVLTPPLAGQWSKGAKGRFERS